MNKEKMRLEILFVLLLSMLFLISGCISQESEERPPTTLEASTSLVITAPATSSIKATTPTTAQATSAPTTIQASTIPTTILTTIQTASVSTTIQASTVPTTVLTTIQTASAPTTLPTTSIPTTIPPYTKIRDLLLNPTEYHQTTVTINGDCLQQNFMGSIGYGGIEVELNAHLLKISDDTGSLCVIYFGEANFDGEVIVKGKLISTEGFYDDLKKGLLDEQSNIRTVITVKPTRIYMSGFTPKADVYVTVYDWIKDTVVSRKIGESTQTAQIGDTIMIEDNKVVIVGIDPVVTKTITVSVWKGTAFLTGNPIGIGEGSERTFEEVRLSDIVEFGDELVEGMKDDMRMSGGEVCVGDYIFQASKIEKVG